MSHPPAGRETSGATTGGLLRYVRDQGGDAAVAEVLRRAGVDATAGELEDQSRWWSYDDRIALFTAATEVIGGPRTMFDVGRAVLETGLAHSLVILLRAMGSPRQVLGQLPRVVQKFSTTSTMEVSEAASNSATIRVRLHDGFPPSRLDCDYTQGLLSTVPQIFSLPPARVAHDECQSDGHPACVYQLSWTRRSRVLRRRRGTQGIDPELHALRGQLQILQSAATDLVASDDVDTVLQRIVSRAAQAVLAPAYLLAVHAPGGGAPLVHGEGLDPERMPELGRRLLDGGDLGLGSVVVDVASARRRHGRLAALYRHGDGAIGDEAAMLAAYAGHAAAALDLIIALEDARTEADRAGALLSLAHGLAATTDAAEVADLVTEALPEIVGCSTAGILLWDAASGTLRSHSAVGLAEEGHDVVRPVALRLEDAPELVGMLTSREPQVVRRGSSSPAMQRLLDSAGTAEAVAVPLLADGAFLGVATAGWRRGEAPVDLDGEVLTRLRGVGDQATTALQKARLLQTVRHQATHDALTGLPNRALFLDRLTTAIATADRRSHLAVLFCDLDRFKQVNDTLGHAAGDELLRQVAARLLAAVRPGDVVGRLSGDEFAVVLPGLAEASDAEGLAARIVDRFRQPFRLEGADAVVGTSVGVAVHPGDGGTAEQLLRTADAAMYRHKHADRPTPARG